MKKQLLILPALLLAASLNVHAQATKTKTPAKKATSTKTQTPAQKNTAKTTKAATTTTTRPKEAAKTSTTADSRIAQPENDYQTAVGLKFIYGISLTGKHFINKNGAIEAIVRYRDYGAGSEFNFSGLYEYHAPISGAPGLRWYAGGGAYLGEASFDYPLDESVFNYGVTGVLGLEYKFKDIPLAINADWQPVFLINSGGGFTGENGGVGVKYTF